jgi:hypothetical protein
VVVVVVVVAAAILGILFQIIWFIYNSAMIRLNEKFIYTWTLDKPIIFPKLKIFKPIFTNVNNFEVSDFMYVISFLLT